MRLKTIILFIIICLFGDVYYSSPKSVYHQSNSDSTKENNPKPSNSISIYQQYFLVQEAHKGNPIAEHELGLRYLNGESFPKDMDQAVYWIKKAADSDLPAANYNLGLLYYRGEGVKWDPFLAFKHVKLASEYGLPDALYLLGLFYLDNFVVPSDFNKAYNYIKAAADSGYKNAINMVKELGDDGVKKLESMYGAENIDREYSKEEIFNLYWKILLNELSKQIKIVKSNDPQSDIEKIVRDTSSVRMIKQLASLGNSEALLILGMFHEKGILKKDEILALEYYFRAIRLDSKWGYFFFKSIYDNQTEYQKIVSEVERRAKNNDPSAMYDFYCLAGLGIDNSIDKAQAFDLLKKAASLKHLPSMIELGLCYAEGKFEKKNPEKAISILQSALDEGTKEAQIWIARINIREKFKYQSKDETISYLLKASDDGILYAQVMLGYCYENGIGVEQDDSKAVELYRTALTRGNNGAALALKQMHDKIRPPEKDFSIKSN